MPRPPFERPLEGLRLARTCYDHLAGRQGVSVTDAMVRRQRDLRRLERESARVKVEATRALLARVNPEIRDRALELLVMRKRITLEDVREVLRPYLDRQLAVIAIGDEEPDGH